MICLFRVLLHQLSDVVQCLEVLTRPVLHLQHLKPFRFANIQLEPFSYQYGLLSQLEITDGLFMQTTSPLAAAGSFRGKGSSS